MDVIFSISAFFNPRGLQFKLCLWTDWSQSVRLVSLWLCKHNSDPIFLGKVLLEARFEICFPLLFKPEINVCDNEIQMHNFAWKPNMKGSPSWIGKNKNTRQVLTWNWYYLPEYSRQFRSKKVLSWILLLFCIISGILLIVWLDFFFFLEARFIYTQDNLGS